MAVTPLSQAILQGMDPNVYRPLADIQQGDAMQQAGMDSSPTSKWGAIGRLANALAGSYISNSSASDLAKTIAGGKKSASEQLMAALESRSVPSAPPSIPPSLPTPKVQPAVPQAITPEPGSPNAQVAARFPAEMSPGSAASPLPNDAPSPLDAAQYPAGPVGTNAQTAASDPISAIAAAATRHGVNPDTLQKIAQIESSGNPNATSSNSSARGLFQFMPDTAKQYGLSNPMDPAASADAAARLMKDNKAALTQALGREPTEGELYLAHQQGAAGAAKLLTNPSAIAASLVGHDAITGNGGSAGMTAGQFANKWTGKIDGPVQLASAAPTVASDADPEVAARGQQVAQNGTPDVHRLMAVMANPYADEATKALASKLILQQLTPKEDEFASSPQGIYNKRTGDLKQGVAGNYGGLQGPELLDAVKQQNPGLAARVQSVLEYKSPYPTGSRLNPTEQQIKELVPQINSDFSAAKFGARSNFEKNMASTVPNSFGGQVRSAGTVAKHLGDAHDAISTIESGALGASDTLPVLNGVKSFVRTQTGDKQYQDATGHYNTAIKGLADEAENLLANGHGAEGSKLYWKDRLDLSKHSPTEVRGALDEFRSLMMGRLSNVAQEKDRVFDQVPGTTDPLSLFGPKERDIMKKISDETYKGPVMGAAPAASAPSTTPDRAALEAEMRKRGLLQ